MGAEYEKYQECNEKTKKNIKEETLCG